MSDIVQGISIIVNKLTDNPVQQLNIIILDGNVKISLNKRISQHRVLVYHWRDLFKYTNAQTIGHSWTQIHT